MKLKWNIKETETGMRQSRNRLKQRDWNSTGRESTDKQWDHFFLQFVRGLFQDYKNALKQRRTSVETTLRWNWNESKMQLKLSWNETERKQKHAWGNPETGLNKTETVLKENQLLASQSASFTVHSRTLSGLWQCWNNAEAMLINAEMKLKWNRKEAETGLRQSETGWNRTKTGLKQHLKRIYWLPMCASP